MKPLLQHTLRHLQRRLQRQRERGAITVIVAVLMGYGVLTGSAAMVVDVGSIYVERTELQTGADAAAGAVAKSCLTGQCGGIALATSFASTNTKKVTVVNDQNSTDPTKTITKDAEAYFVCGRWGTPNQLPLCSSGVRLGGNLSGCVGTAPASDDYVEVWVKLTTSDSKNLLPPTLSRSLVGNAGYDGTAITACSRIGRTSYQTQRDPTPTPTPTATQPNPTPSPTQTVVTPSPTATTTSPTPTPTATTTAPASQCVKAKDATYHHTFDGPRGVATIKPDKQLCLGESQPVTLVSYTAPDSNFALPQFVYGVDMQTITSTTSTSTGLSFKVDVPVCYTQVDFVFRSSPINPLDSMNNLYNDVKIGSANGLGSRSIGVQGWYNSGTRACSPKPSMTWAKSCTALTVTLLNDSTANVDASFTVTTASGTQYVRVAKGTSTPVAIPSATAALGVTVSENLIQYGVFVSATQTWTPKKNC